MSRHKRSENEDPAIFMFYSHTCGECGKPTAERKPYCIDHICHMDYVKTVRAELDAREKEMNEVINDGYSAVNLDGSRAIEILDLVRERGAMTMGRLSNEILMTVNVIKIYAKRLELAGLVKIKAVSGKSHRHLVVADG